MRISSVPGDWCYLISHSANRGPCWLGAVTVVSGV